LGAGSLALPGPNNSPRLLASISSLEYEDFGVKDMSSLRFGSERASYPVLLVAATI